MNAKHSCLCYVFVSIFLFLFTSCLPEKRLKESEFLLVKNKLTADRKDVPVGDISYVIRPRPNKRMFGLFLWNVGIYQSLQPDTSRFNDSTYCHYLRKSLYSSLGRSELLLDTFVVNKHIANFQDFKRWTQKTFGQPPVFLDSALIDYSLQQIDISMRNRGYFNAKTNYQVSYKRKRASVHYFITAGIPYRIYQIDYQIADEGIAQLLLSDTARFLVKSGQQYNVDNLDAERERITNRLLNRGYYGFSKNNIRFEADTSLNAYVVNIKMIIDNPRYKIDDSTIVEGKHRRYAVNSISIYTDYSEMDDFSITDSIHYYEVVKRKDTNHYVLYYNNFEQRYKPATLIYPIYFKSGDLYSRLRSQRTYDRFLSMKNFDYIKILYSETPQSQKNYQSDTAALDCRIMLVSKKRQSIGFELLTKNIGGAFGLGGNISYLNRNIFRRAESLQFTLKYTQELRIDSIGAHFQNFETGGTITLEFPRFLFPVKPQNVPKQLFPKTLIGLSVNYLSQKQYHYARFLTNTSFTYEWSERKTTSQVRLTHSLTVWDFSIVKLYKDHYFDSITQSFFASSKRVAEKYKDNFLLGSSYQITLQKNPQYVFRAGFRAYGNLLYGLMRAAGKSSGKYKIDSLQYAIWGIPFATGITADFDFVYNILQKRKNVLIYHFALGIGVPTANSSVLPFEYSYYLGGSNSMRAWQARTVGPGGHADTLILDRVGDIKFEMNLEYRTPIYKRLHLGMFIDAGNVWLLRKMDGYYNGEFAFNRFFKEIAISAGMGLRLDLSFFVIRVDYALKIHNPAVAGVRGWQHFQWKNYRNYTADRGIVIGIGYPF